MKVPAEGFKAWEDGGLIQEVMPDLSADDRETLMSGICVKCWDKQFEQDDEDEVEGDDEVEDEDEVEGDDEYESFKIAGQLSNMTQQKRLKNLRMLILNLLDYHQQSDEEQLYIDLHNRIEQEEQKIGTKDQKMTENDSEMFANHNEM